MTKLADVEDRTYAVRMPSLFADHPVILRGGGDLATGVAWRLCRSGFPVIVLELAAPLTVRRRVALSEAVHEGVVDVEGMVGIAVDSLEHARVVSDLGSVAVLVSPTLPPGPHRIVVDARLAKRNIDTTIADADLVIGLGPGFRAGVDCHAVIETMRGPRLGRVIREGSTTPDTGTPAEVGGRGAERVLRAPQHGTVEWVPGVEIGDRVTAESTLGNVGGAPIVAPFDGIIRGLIRSGTTVAAGLKIGDVDPRGADVAADEISDKALAIGGGVLEAVLAHLTNR